MTYYILLSLATFVGQIIPWRRGSTVGLGGADSILATLSAPGDWANGFVLANGLFSFVAGPVHPVGGTVHGAMQFDDNGTRWHLNLTETDRITPLQFSTSSTQWAVAHVLQRQGGGRPVDITMNSTIVAAASTIANFADYLFLAILLLVSHVALLWNAATPITLPREYELSLRQVRGITVATYSLRWLLCLMQAASIMTYSTFYKGISTWAIRPQLAMALGDDALDANRFEAEVASRLRWRWSGRFMVWVASLIARLFGTSEFESDINLCRLVSTKADLTHRSFRGFHHCEQRSSAVDKIDPPLLRVYPPLEPVSRRISALSGHSQPTWHTTTGSQRLRGNFIRSVAVLAIGDPWPNSGTRVESDACSVRIDRIISGTDSLSICYPLDLDHQYRIPVAFATKV